MKRCVEIVFLLLTTVVWLLGGMSFTHNFVSTSSAVNSSHSNDVPSETAVFSISSTTPALPVQVEKVRICSLQLSARQHHRLISESVFGRPADTCKARYTAVRIYLSLSVLPGLDPPDISFPFTAFW